MKRKNLKMVSLLLVALLVVMFVGCSSDSKQDLAGSQNQNKVQDSDNKQNADSNQQDTDQQEDNGEIRLAIYVDLNDEGVHYSVKMKEIIEEFEQTTGIKVNAEMVPFDQLESKLIITNNGGNPVDVSYISSQKLSSLVNAGALMPLDDYIKESFTEEDLNDFSPVEKAATTSALDGKKYAQLLSIHSRLMYINTNIIPEDRIPTTWDELVEVGKEVTKPEENIYAFVANLNKHYGAVEQVIAPFIWTAGGRIADDNGNLVTNSPEALEAIQFLSDIVNVHGIAPKSIYTADGTQVRDMFTSGNIGIIIDNPAEMNVWRETDFAKEGKLTWAPLPTKDKDGKSYNFSNGFALAIPTNAANPDKAWEFIKFMSSSEIQLKHSLAEGGAPTRISSREHETYDTDWWQFVFDNMDKNGRSMDPLVYYQEGLETVATVAVSYFLDPSQDLQKLMDDAVNNFNEKYNK